MDRDRFGKARPVYSTGVGRRCRECGRAIDTCDCRRERGVAAPAKSGVRVRLETKGRKGKGVTVVTGVPLDDAELGALARDLKRRCGAGGTVKDGVIEIQGDRRDAVTAELERRGHTVKRGG